MTKGATMTKPILTIVRDLPGSGKSTYARKLAAGCYGCNGDWRKLIYWLSAAVLTASVTF